MKPKIIFIHGMFLTGKSWEHWVQRFEELGYECVASSWPLHEAEPWELRLNPPTGTGDLLLNTVIDYYADLAEHLAERPILIGHSLGGLVAQILMARGLASAAVCISSVAPNAIPSVDEEFLKNSTEILNPFERDRPVKITEEDFHRNFCNMMTRSHSNAAYRRYAVHESRAVLRDAMGRAGQIDVQQWHEPLLFIAGENDEIAPQHLSKMNADAYTDATSVTEFKSFPERCHFICGQQGWQEVADYAAEWLQHIMSVQPQLSFSR